MEIIIPKLEFIERRIFCHECNKVRLNEIKYMSSGKAKEYFSVLNEYFSVKEIVKNFDADEMVVNFWRMCLTCLEREDKNGMNDKEYGSSLTISSFVTLKKWNSIINQPLVGKKYQPSYN